MNTVRVTMEVIGPHLGRAEAVARGILAAVGEFPGGTVCRVAEYTVDGERELPDPSRLGCPRCAANESDLRRSGVVDPSTGKAEVFCTGCRRTVRWESPEPVTSEPVNREA